MTSNIPALSDTAKTLLAHLIKPYFAFPATLDPRKTPALAESLGIDEYDVQRELKKLRLLTL